MLEKWNIKNYYDILGVNDSSTYEEIYLAYVNSKEIYSLGNSEIANSFTKDEIIEIQKLIEDAFTVLSNSCLNEVYKSKTQPKEMESKPISRPLPKLSAPLTHDEDVYEKKMDGKFLEKIRGKIGISVEDLSLATKIKPHFIHAIESNNYNALPAAVYTRGFIQQIARSLGLDAKKVASSYMSYYF